MGAVQALDPLGGVRIVDCDSHLTEPADLWSSRAPRGFADRMPVQRTVDGITSWYIDGEPWASTGGNTITTGLKKNLGTHVIQPFELLDRAAWSVKERLELCDLMGVWAQVLYPNGVGFSSNHIFAIADVGLRTAVLQTYNDFYVDVQAESGGRLLPQALLPVWDMDLCVREMSRLVEKGITGFTLSDKPELIGLPELREPYFDPMWDLFNESGAVASFHIGSGARREDMEAIRGMVNVKRKDGEGGAVAAPPSQLALSWSSFGPQRQKAVMSAQMIMSNVRILANLCMSDLFDRYPKLKVVSAESGIGWVPYMLEALEYQLDEMITNDDEVSFQKRRPTDYFRDHMYVMFWFEQSAPEKLIDTIGVNNVLVETDVPHPTCLYPGTREHFAKVLANVDDDVRRRVLQDNAAELYGVTIPS
jgi:uncharacterized protein